jgi:tRNA1(Val) A37 N6-methylase TrmN6
LKSLVEKDKLRILVLGTGAGVFPMFLKTNLGESLGEIVTVDINPEIVKVGFLRLLTILIGC